MPGATAAATRRLFLTTVSAAALTAVCAGSTAAQTWNGGVSTDWTNAANWTGGLPANGGVSINTTVPNPTVLGVSGAATGTSGTMFVSSAGGSGSLTIQNGSTLASNPSGFSFVGVNAGSTGVVNVTGAGSAWNINGVANSLILGRNLGAGTSTLNISNGGAVRTAGDIVVGEANATGFLNVTSGGTLTTGRDGYIGRFGGSNGTATITGTGSSWGITNRLFIGNGGPGALTISNNATVDVGTSTIVGDSASAGTFNITSGGVLQTQTLVRGTGPVQVNFDAATLRAKTNTTSFVSGFSGTQLNIAAGGLTVDTAGFDVTASSPFSGTGTFTKVGAGTLTLSGANSTNFSGVMAINAGTLSVATATNLGTGGLAFDGGTLQNTGAFATALPVTLNAGGGTFQTDASLTLAGIIGGNGALTKTGASALTLTGANTYSGQTWIQSGTLALSGNGAIASSSRVVADGTFDISAVTPTGANIQSLAGAGSVALGAKTLTLTNANDTFAGSITGTGGLTVSAGTETLTGTSNYTGATNVNGTGTLQLLNGGQIIGTNITFLNGPGATATATVSGAGSLLQTGTLGIGAAAGSNATLNILNGGVVRTTVNSGTVLGGASGQTATINVDGAGSLLDHAGSLSIGGSNSATNAFLNVTNGGAVRSLSGVVGIFTLGTGTKSALISGPGSSWAVTNNLNISGNASMAVMGGGAVTAAASNIGSGGTSALLVAGAGSSYAITGNVTVGNGPGTGTGAVTLADGGGMAVGGTLRLANLATQTGILNIGGAEGQAATGAGTLDAATLVFGPGTGRVNFNHTDANYVFSTAMSGTGTINQLAGFTNLTGNSSGFTGTTSVQGGTLAVNGSLCGGMNVLAGGRLQGNGTVCDTNNAGVVAPGNSIGTLTVLGNYVGNGGTLEIESVLGGDASPSDRLVVTGNTSGSTNVKVINLGGTGGPTTNGIKIVDVGGASNGTFSLLGDYVFQGQQAVIGGAYAYTLQKNGVTTPADGDWYLRSSLINPPPDLPAGPLLQPGVPLYENYGRVLQGLNGLPTLQQRVGNRYWTADTVAAPSAGTSADSAPTAFWGRAEGTHNVMDNGTTTGSRYSADQFKMQAGLDGLFLENGSGRLFGGFNAQYGSANARIRSVWGDGRINTSAYSVGTALTWIGDNGFYVDGQAQGTIFKSNLKSDIITRDMVHDDSSFGYAFSTEVGKRIGLGDGGWTVTPQAQLIYSAVNFNFTDAFGTRVSLTDGDSLNSRFGLSLDREQSWRDANGKLARLSTYGIANVYYEFLDGQKVDVAGTMFASNGARLEGGLGFGGTYSWNDGKYSVHGEAMVRSDLNDEYSVGGIGGFSVKW